MGKFWFERNQRGSNKGRATTEEGPAEVSKDRAPLVRPLGISLFLLIAVLSWPQGGLKAQDQSWPPPSGTPARKPAPPPKRKSEEDPGRSSSTSVSVLGKSVHISCNRSLRDLANNRLECFGNVYIRRPNELLTADYVSLDIAKDQLHAEGNVVYFTAETVIYGAKMDFNLTTETGVIEDGRIDSDKYELLGDRIEKLSEDHFFMDDGEYTTCRDCPASWRLRGKSVDMTVNGYVKMTHVFIKVNDAPTLWFPALIVPVKTKRQSGFLFPKFGTSQQNGFMFLQPYFWAISRSMDATLAAGNYSSRGPKGAAEYRYTLSDRTKGQFNGFYLSDRKFVEPYNNRWAVDYNHNWALPWKIDQRLHWVDISDRDYARFFPEDIEGGSEAALVSDAGISRTGRDLSVWVTAKRIRNTLTPNFTGFDNNTVQLLPQVNVATSDHRLSESFPLHWGISGTYSRFWRTRKSFDPISPEGYVDNASAVFVPGVTPLRRAERYTFVPQLYYTARLFDVLTFVPSVEYRTFYYRFDPNVAPSTNRQYLVTQAELSTTIERAYSAEIKHKFTPALKYSNIPMFKQDSSHPFVQQLQVLGNQFDDNDIVPITSVSQTYFVPLGNSLTYRLGNKFILKADPKAHDYRKVVDFSVGQSINFKEFQRGREGEPLSRFYAIATVDSNRLQGTGEYYYYPYLRASTYSLGTRFIFARYTRRLLIFERSFGLSYNYNQVTSRTSAVGGDLFWSFNDFFSAVIGAGYQFPMAQHGAVSPGLLVTGKAGVTYQSPSQCYRLSLLASYTANLGWNMGFSLPINLSGEGFTSFTDPAAGGSPGMVQ